MAQLRAEDVQMEENNKITPPRKNPAHPATVATESVMLQRNVENLRPLTSQVHFCRPTRKTKST